MGSEQPKRDEPTVVTGRTHTAIGLRKPQRVTSRSKAVQPVPTTVRRVLKAAQAGRLGVRKPVAGPSSREAEAAKPYPPPSFLGMFDLPADAAGRVKDVVRGRDDD
ncbi:hypothetical protein GCM10023192_84390 [Amycolatopsis samaneae]